MRQEFVDRFNAILLEKIGSAWKDGWVYGCLREEFSLQPDELEFIATRLGFKQGWNPGLESLLEQQWQEQQVLWEQYKRNQANHAAQQERIQRLQASPQGYPAMPKHPEDRGLDDLTATSVSVDLNSLEYLLLRCIVGMPRREQLKLLEQLRPYRPTN